MRQLTLLLFLLPLAARAAAESLPETAGSVVQVFLSLGVVLALLVGGLWLMKRLTQPQGGPAGGVLRVVSAAAVGPRERVVVVEVGASWLVLGVAPGCVNLLAEAARQDVPGALAASAAPASGFGGLLNKLMERKNAARM